ncbi:MAG: hypothetical protein KGO82_12770 [Bacteroidota bacterium]|nr:hypothetical protein [Bacteroidota bacterium]
MSAIIMMAALLFLATANYWVYGFRHQVSVNASQPDESTDSDAPTVPNPTEEKTCNSLQNLSEYLHEDQHHFIVPFSTVASGNRHDVINLPIHHPELLTPPPKYQS